MEKNMLALEVTKKYVTEQLSKHDPYVLGPVAKADRVVLNGNQAVIAGALAAQCRFFAGYPITPASDIMEGLAKELPLVGGTFLQAEDEMAALAAVLGASYGGVRAMTATSCNISSSAAFRRWALSLPQTSRKWRVSAACRLRCFF